MLEGKEIGIFAGLLVLVTALIAAINIGFVALVPDVSHGPEDTKISSEQ